MKRSSFVLFISLLGFGAKAQHSETASFTTLMCKEWKLQYFGENGKRQPPSSQQGNDRMIFYKDNSVLSIEMGQKQKGIWQYDTAKKQLTIIDNDTKEKTLLHVIRLDDKQFVVGYKEAEGPMIEIHMQPVR